jgi:hypothetical protein
MVADIIGGFPYADPNCKGCGKPLTIENAWMTDGCPCNTALGVNSMNETRWRLLMQLQQRLERTRHLFAEWSGRVSFLCDGIRGHFSRHDEAAGKVFGPQMDDVLSFTPNKINELAKG